ncbi:MAG TPA: acyl-CoA dehydrogenase family protein [Baekduia sp.]|uniref:acyl-CoA dehydrogenase family protein n=1 Tax=Baekduia sp. TaxID=2600305 RepID=UPI002D76A8B7|nr:acyl-CoA dehydrogenase family protein [Baekduia sp.]HET6507048.1 acyl-CoA dehydrogenase family protein [Baekduia sp.]
MSALADGPVRYGLTQEQRDLRDMVRELAVGRIAPRAAAIDAAGEFPQDVRQLLAEHDVLALPFAEAYGGTGTGTLMTVVAIEEIAKACASSALILAVHDLGTLPIRIDGSDELKARVLPKYAAGEWLAAFALSEPDAGSDAGALRTNAVAVDGGWRLNGAKNWITNAGVAGAYVVFAVTDGAAPPSRGMTAFLVEADAPGFAVAKLEHKMGMRGSPTGQLTFDDVFVPDGNVIGSVGDGFKVAMRTLDRSRLGIAAQALGIAQGATDYAAAYARERTAFGKPINQLQAIQFKLADMETRTAAARELLYRAAAKADHDEPDLGKYSAMAKLFCSDTAMDVTVEAVQVLGGYGYVTEYPVERMMRDAKLTQIYEGTNEIQRVVVGRSLR